VSPIPHLIQKQTNTFVFCLQANALVVDDYLVCLCRGGLKREIDQGVGGGVGLILARAHVLVI